MKIVLFQGKHLNFLLICSFLAFSFGCQKTETGYANLSVSSVEFTQTYHVEYIDLPDGVYVPDNPNFSMNNPSTWTGNMAQYVVNKYFYTVNYEITNSGAGTAHGTEVDFGYFFDTGSDQFETISIGNVIPGQKKQGSFQLTSLNKQLEECAAEVYWYDY